MKHLKFTSLLAMLTLFSCQQELQETHMATEQEGEHITITARSGETGSKTAVQDDGAIWWSPSDCINVFYGKVNLGKFTSILDESNPYTVFVSEKSYVMGSLVGGEILFWGVYPYAEGNTCDGNSVTLAVPSAQNAVEASYDPEAFPSVGCSATQQMAFYNVCGGVRFMLSTEGVTSVSMKGNGGEVLAGKVKVGLDGESHPEVIEVLEPKTEVTLTCKGGFKTGVWYYIAALPAALEDGVSFTLKSSGKMGTKEITNSVEVKRSIFGSIAGLDEGADWMELPAANQIFYTTSDEQILTLFDSRASGDEQNMGLYKDEIYDSNNNKLSIVSNVYSNGQGVMTFDGEIAEIGISAFHNCSNLTSMIIPEGVTTINRAALQNCVRLTSVILPESVTSIGDYAFSHCSSLASIVIPEGVTSIGGFAFMGCSSLTSIVIPEGVTSIGGYAFSHCSSLASIVIPEGVTSIGGFAFYGCSSLTSIVIPEGVNLIGNYAFSYCRSLTSIVIPEGVTSISDCALWYCSKLTSIVIPEGVTSIGDWAFRDCSSLTSIVIPEGVTSIGESAFRYCDKLSDINCLPNTPPTIGSNAFNDCPALSSILVPYGSGDTYKSAWPEYASYIQEVKPSIIIKELYCTGCVKDDGKTTYSNDAYVTLYNNSKFEADVTDIVFGILQPANAHNSNNKYIVDGVLSYSTYVPAYSAIWFFQNPTKIAPYSSLTVAIFGAINHTTTVSNSVDLSKPEYYVMSKTGVSQITNSKYQVAETIPTDHYLSAKMFNLGNAWVLSNTSPAFFIGQMKLADLTALIDNTADYDLQGESDNIGGAPKFPVNHIVDAIECWDSANIAKSNHRFPASVNTGHAVIHSRLGHSFYRNVDKAATEALPENAGKLVYGYAGGTADMEGTTDPSGIDAEASIAAGCHIVFSDTNNSGTDFHERKTAALKK